MPLQRKVHKDYQNIFRCVACWSARTTRSWGEADKPQAVCRVASSPERTGRHPRVKDGHRRRLIMTPLIRPDFPREGGGPGTARPRSAETHRRGTIRGGGLSNLARTAACWPFGRGALASSRRRDEDSLRRRSISYLPFRAKQAVRPRAAVADDSYLPKSLAESKSNCRANHDQFWAHLEDCLSKVTQEGVGGRRDDLRLRSEHSTHERWLLGLSIVWHCVGNVSVVLVAEFRLRRYVSNSFVFLLLRRCILVSPPPNVKRPDL